MITQHEILVVMERFGGGFVQALARCFRAADGDNQRKLAAAFPEVFEKYRELAKTIPAEKLR